MQRVSIEVRLLRLTARHTPGCVTVRDPPAVLPPDSLMEPIVTLVLPAELPIPEPVASQPSPEPVAASKSEPPPESAHEPTRVLSACPNCGGTFVYESKARMRFEQFLGWIGAPLRRCHRCYYRYLEMLGFKFGKEPLE
jgi:hypothetical protein